MSTLLDTVFDDPDFPEFPCPTNTGTPYVGNHIVFWPGCGGGSAWTCSNNLLAFPCVEFPNDEPPPFFEALTVRGQYAISSDTGALAGVGETIVECACQDEFLVPGCGGTLAGSAFGLSLFVRTDGTVWIEIATPGGAVQYFSAAGVWAINGVTRAFELALSFPTSFSVTYTIAVNAVTVLTGTHTNAGNTPWTSDYFTPGISYDMAGVNVVNLINRAVSSLTPWPLAMWSRAQITDEASIQGWTNCAGAHTLTGGRIVSAHLPPPCWDSQTCPEPTITGLEAGPGPNQLTVTGTGFTSLYGLAIEVDGAAPETFEIVSATATEIVLGAFLPLLVENAEYCVTVTNECAPV